MRNLFNPKWLLFINTMPIAVMAWMYYGNYVIIASLLSSYNISLWIKFGLCLGILWLFHLGYALILIFKKRKIHGWYGVTVLATYIPFLYLYHTYVDDIIPFGIPGWMMPENVSLYASTFVMPTLAHGLFTLVVSLTRDAEHRKPVRDFVIAILCPVAWYIFLQVILPLWRSIDKYIFSTHVLVVLVITGTVVFLFFVSRGVYIVSVRKKDMLQEYAWIWKIIVAIVFPVLGLAINSNYGGMFGNFSDAWFYVLAVTNGILVCIPDPERKLHRLLLFAARSITFSFIFYFFLVFLPFLPLSVLAIIVVGTGFLMLTPLVLMIIQSAMMSRDINFLSLFYPKKFIYSILLAGVLVLPLSVTWNYISDRRILHKALDCVFADNLNNENISVSASSLKNVLGHVEANKRNRGSFKRQAPYLSSFYNWLVLDNLSLSDSKLNLLERVFTGRTDTNRQSFPQADRTEGVKISNIRSQSIYDEQQQAWKSKVELELLNQNLQQGEFATEFILPDGAWISDYYLWIENEKVPGILAEKKAATWIYQQIRSFRQDPGILYYVGKNKIALRVFPMESHQTRVTGFEVLHKEPVSFAIGGHPVALGNETENIEPGVIHSGKAAYLSAKSKKSLPIVERTPVYHFIIDCSEGKEANKASYINRIEDFATHNNVELSKAAFTLCNAYATRLPHWSDFKNLHSSQIFTGGFYVERSIKKILSQACQFPTLEYPVIVVVADSTEDAILEKDFSQYQQAFPESDSYYWLDAHNNIVAYSLLDPLAKPYIEPVKHAVIAWPDANSPEAFLRLDDQPSIFLNRQGFEDVDFNRQDWKAALALQGEWLAQPLNPSKDKHWRQLVQKSFEAHILTPSTSFISLENEAQRQVLLKKQNDVLQANSLLDIDEETRMSEPGWMLSTIIIVVFIAGRNQFFAKESYKIINI